MIETFNAVDISSAPNFFIRKEMCDMLIADGIPVVQAQSIVNKMDIQVSQDVYEEVGKEMMDKLLISMVGVLVRYNEQSLKAGLGPVTDGSMVNLKLG
jgi:hypothetical protein